MADTNSIAEKVKEIIARNLEIRDSKTIVPEATLQEDLGADSLDAVELIMNLEEEFGIEIEDSDAEKLKTVGDVINYVQDRKAE